MLFKRIVVYFNTRVLSSSHLMAIDTMPIFGARTEGRVTCAYFIPTMTGKIEAFGTVYNTQSERFSSTTTVMVLDDDV